MSISELEELRHILEYDPDSGKIIWKGFRGNGVKPGTEAGYLNEEGYRVIQIRRKNYKAHRIAWVFTHGQWPKVHLDHIDGNPSNNRISNLRECTVAENQQNRGISKNNTSGFIGVSFHKLTNKWMARIRINGHLRYIGVFDNPEDASEAYLSAKAELHKFQPVPRQP